MLAVRTLLKLQSINVLKIRVLGDDSHTIVPQGELRRLDIDRLVKESRQMFNLTLNKKKIVLTDSS